MNDLYVQKLEQQIATVLLPIFEKYYRDQGVEPPKLHPILEKLRPKKKVARIEQKY